jgi:hypothetical protein
MVYFRDFFHIFACKNVIKITKYAKPFFLAGIKGLCHSLKAKKNPEQIKRGLGLVKKIKYSIQKT